MKKKKKEYEDKCDSWQLNHQEVLLWNFLWVKPTTRFDTFLQESRRLHRPLGRNVYTSAQLPLPKNLRFSQTLTVLIVCWVCVRRLIRRSEVYGFITRVCTNWVWCFPLLSNVPASILLLPRVPCLLDSLFDCLRAPPAWPLRSAGVNESTEMSFRLRRGWVFESRWAGGGAHDRSGPRR